MIDSVGKVGFVYVIELVRKGVVIDREVVHNMVPTVGLNHILDVVVLGGTQYANWYLGLYEGNYTPTAGITMTTLPSTATETTAYVEATRQAFVPGAVTGGTISNLASKAEFTFTANKTLYGGFMTSNDVKSSTTGMLLSVVRFASPKNAEVDDVLRVLAGIELISA